MMPLAALEWCPRRSPSVWGARSVREVPCASTRALAHRHGVSERTARRWLEQGRVPGAFRATEGWWLPTYELREETG